jgi:Mrp family chromosome partitioning ATPase
MSRHFELLQQMEREERIGSGSRTAMLSPSNGNVRQGAYPREWADAEALRLVQQIFLLQTHEPPRVVVFAGIDHGNGCSRICASVAEILATNARRPVCLVDANFRSPALAAMYGASDRDGLTEALLQKRPITSLARPVERHNLWLLSTGTVATDSPNLLSADNLRDALAELREDFDFVIIDAPPLTRYSDALVLSQHSEGLVVILEAQVTRREAASVAVSNLRAANVPILAAVLNKRTFPIPEKIYSRL